MSQPVPIALLGNVTTEYIGNEIRNECLAYGMEAQIYNAPYQQYNQEILDPDSAFYAFKPDIVILILEGSELFPHWYELQTYIAGRESREKQVRDMAEQLQQLMDTIRSHSEAKIIFNSFRIPYHTPLGILDNRTALGLKQMIASLNLRLEEYAAANDNIHVFDYNGFCAHTGQSDLEDHKLYYLAKSSLTYPAIKLAAHEYLRFILPLKSFTRKCLVLDLDNTLWGGIAGEDGTAGIDLDLTGTGRSFYNFQREILNLYNKGILLAINSKNNPEDALDILQNHPHMLLKKEYFSCMKINWQDKASNMKEIAAELNIGLDSLVFFDDNPVEREFIRSMLPQVAVVEVPADVSKYCAALKDIVEFESLRLTEEDIKRNELYKNNIERQELQQKVGSRDEYLAGLNTELFLRYADAYSIPRISQLTQKTNQFNMTTRRYLQEDIENMANSARQLVIGCSVSDRFGDSGIVGCCIVALGKENAHMDTFLLSCRVLGRDVEYAFLSAVVKILQSRGFTRITSEFILTGKNKANRDFYPQAGFVVKEENQGLIRFILPEGTQPTDSRYVTVHFPTL